MSKSYLLIDGNSIGHAANASTVLTVGDTQVQAIYSYLRVLKSLVSTYSLMTPMVLWDGASWRNMSFLEYKANREKTDTANERTQLEAKQNFRRQVGAIRKATALLGVAQLYASNMEADDLAGIMVERCEQRGDKALLVTADKDWIQLIGPNVTWFDPIHKINGKTLNKVMPSNLEERFGVTSTKQFVELKALMGDLGDNIPGVGGIGEVGGVELLRTYGSVSDFLNAAIFEKSVDLKKLPKKFRRLVEEEEKLTIFQRNLELMDLRTKARPAPINMKLDLGEPDAERFKLFCEKLMFRSILKDQFWLDPFPAFRKMENAA